MCIKKIRSCTADPCLDMNEIQIECVLESYIYIIIMYIYDP